MSTPTMTTTMASTAAAATAADSGATLGATVAGIVEASTSGFIGTTTTTTAAATTVLKAPVIATTAATATAAASATASVAATATASAEATVGQKLSVGDLSSSLQHFGYADYAIFILMLIICAVIGFYFGFMDRRKAKSRSKDKRRGSEALDYLVGGRKMSVLPVALSLVASFISGISLLGTSTEIYVYGTQYAFVLFSLVISGVISWYVFLPVFCNLQLTSTYEYLEMRYNKVIRLFGSVLFTIGTVFWLPIVIYVPALAFNQVTGINIHIITPVVCAVCIFYTCVGGLKAVVWTDVIQSVIMLGAILLVVIKGTLDIGGLGVVWQRNWDSGRIEAPTMTMDPTERISMFSVLFGATFFYVQCTSGNQVIMQRYLSVPGVKEAKRALVYFTLGVTVLFGVCFYNGLLIFATYHDCDPLTTKLAKAKDQLVPLLVMDILGVYPGMPGLFVAGVFSAALSSLSTGLNSLSAVFLEDYIKPLRKTPLTEFQTSVVMRLVVLVMGVICVGLVFVVERMGTVLQLSMALGSISCGPLLGLFLMGLLLPWINPKSALTGSIFAFVVMSWICGKGQFALATHEVVYDEKPVSIAGCSYQFETLTSAISNSTFVEESTKTFAQYFYHMSFLLYACAGTLLTLISSGAASLVFGRNDPSKMDQALFAPLVRRFIKPAEYVSVQPDEQTVIMDFEVIKSDTKDS